MSNRSYLGLLENVASDSHAKKTFDIIDTHIAFVGHFLK